MRTRRLRGAVTPVAVATLLVVGVGTSLAAVLPKTAPSVKSLAASPSSLSQFGGSVTVSATVDNASTCVLSVSPSISGLPFSDHCGGAYSHSFQVPANLGKSTTKWVFTLTATGSGSASAHVDLNESSVSTKLSVTWQGGVQLEGNAGTPTDIACATFSNCWTTDANGYVIDLSGNAQLIDSSAITSISCTTDDDCVAVDDTGQALDYKGGTWSTPSSISSAPLTGVSCVEVSGPAEQCVAVSQTGNAYVFDGTHWSSATSIDTTATLNGVACDETGSCVAVDAAGDVVSYSSGSWGSVDHEDGNGDLTAVSCASSTECVAVDSAGDAIVGSGSSWSAPTSIDVGQSLSAVSCAPSDSATDCTATDDNGNVVRDNNGTWIAPSNVSSTMLVGVSCTGSSSCNAVNEAGQRFSWAGSGWTSSTQDAGDGTFDAVACASALNCTAVSSTGEFSSFNGSTWSLPAATRAKDLLSVSCSGSFCAAGASNGDIITATSGSWGAPVAVTSSPITSISCVSQTFCMAVDLAGNYSLWDGSHWSKSTNVLPPEGLGFGSVACASNTVCVMTDHWGAEVVWQLGKSPIVAYAGSAGSDLRGIGCPTTTECLTVDAFGNTEETKISGSSYIKKAARVGNTIPDGFNGISCPTAFFCGAVDTGGHFYIYLNAVRALPVSFTDGGTPLAIGCSSDGGCAVVGSNNVVYTGRVK